MIPLHKDEHNRTHYKASKIMHQSYIVKENMRMPCTASVLRFINAACIYRAENVYPQKTPKSRSLKPAANGGIQQKG